MIFHDASSVLTIFVSAIIIYDFHDFLSSFMIVHDVSSVFTIFVSESRSHVRSPLIPGPQPKKTRKVKTKRHKNKLLSFHGNV